MASEWLTQKWASFGTGPGCHSQQLQPWVLLTDKIVMAWLPFPQGGDGSDGD